MTRRRRQNQSNRGSALFLVVGVLAVVSIFAATFTTMLNRTMTQATRTERHQICLNLAEAGLEKALAKLRAGDATYTGENQTPLGEGQYTIQVTSGGQSGSHQIVATGELVDGKHVLAQARVSAEVVLDASGTIQSLNWAEVKRW